MIELSERTISWRGCDDNLLVGSAFGDPLASPVLLLHGGGQTRHAWGGTGRALAKAGYLALSLDMRGHGESDWVDDGDYQLDAFVHDLETILPHFNRPPAVVGASLGGLTAMLTEGESVTERLSALILVDVAHRLERSGVERVVGFMKSRLDEGFGTLEEAADAIAAYMPHRRRPTDLSGLAKNLRLGEDGRYRWHWDPRFVAGPWGPDPDKIPRRLKESAANLHIPTLLVRGRLSDVLSEDASKEFLELAPAAEYVDVAAAAHMIAGDKNDVFTDAVVGFLGRMEAVGG